MMMEDELVHRAYEFHTWAIWATAAVVATAIVLWGRRAAAADERVEPAVAHRQPTADSR
jgi:hypothetical protein